MRLSASLVLYHSDPAEFGRAMRSFLEGSGGTLFVVDNSATPLQHPLFADPRVRYLFAGDNLGFGKAHNLALREIGDTSDAHLLLNPDIAFGPDVLSALLRHLRDNPEIGAIMPRIEYPDGSLQRLCKLLPTPVDLILRRFIPFAGVRALINRRYELHDLPQDEAACIPSISGCFLLARTDLLQRLGGFDERYFMYMEDVDLVRRIGSSHQTLYYPHVSVMHGYNKGSYFNRNLLAYHLKSAILYFRKWGWLFDRERRQRNRDMLSRLRRKP